jgi:hypothetical protein
VLELPQARPAPPRRRFARIQPTRFRS